MQPQPSSPPPTGGPVQTDRRAASPHGRTRWSQETRAAAAELRGRALSRPLLTGGVRAAEFAIMLSSGLAARAASDGPTGIAGVGVLCAAPFIGLLFIQCADAYQAGMFATRSRQIGRVAGAWTLVFGALALSLFLYAADASAWRGWLGAWYAAGLAALVLFRLGLSLKVRAWQREGRLERRALIVGGGEPAAEVIRGLEAAHDSDIRICGVFDDRSDERSPPVVAGYPKLGTVAELVDFARVARIDLLIITIPLTAEGRISEILHQLMVLPVDIRLSAHTDKLMSLHRATRVGSLPLVDLASKPLADWDALAKRIFDLVAGALLLVLVAPILLATAIAIKLDSRGPVFFRQRRYGFNNQVVHVLKFRSLYHDMADQGARRSVTKDDPRVTRVGRFIRKASIDELPQLVNVLAGTLSLVGPRPHPVHSHLAQRPWEAVVDGYFARHKVKPGVTGWAQINGWRGEIDNPDKLKGRVEYDLYYIENWSLLFDLIIVLRTPIALLRTENAY